MSPKWKGRQHDHQRIPPDQASGAQAAGHRRRDEAGCLRAEGGGGQNFPEPLEEQEFFGGDAVVELAAAPDEIFPEPLEDDDVDEMVGPAEPDEIFPEPSYEDLSNN
jgi:hypothetical protein